jgi:hypothetical protein
MKFTIPIILVVMLSVLSAAVQADDLLLKKKALSLQAVPTESAQNSVTLAQPAKLPAISDANAQAVNPQTVERAKSFGVPVAQPANPVGNLPAPANNMSGQANAVNTAIKPLNTGVQLKAMQPVSFEEVANKQKCGDKRCILDINGLPLSQVVITAAKTPSRYKINGWGFEGKVLFATLNVNNSNKINLNVINNTSTQVLVELPSDIGRAQNGAAQLLIAMSADGYGVYAKELIKFEVQAAPDDRINAAEIGKTNVSIDQKVEPKSLSACKNCIESVNNKLSNIVYEVGGQNLTIKGDGFGEKPGKILLHLNGQSGNKTLPLELVNSAWSNALIVAKVPDSTTGVLDDNNAMLELTKADGQPLSGSSASKVKLGKFIAAREITTLTTLDIPRKIQQEGIAPTNMMGDFYHQELECAYEEKRCEQLKHGFTDVFTVDTKEGFEVLKDQTVVEFDYTVNGMTFSSNSEGRTGDWEIYWYPGSRDHGKFGDYDWQGNRLMVHRYMKQYRNPRTWHGTDGNSMYASGAKVLVKIRGPRGISPLHVSQNASKK